MKKLLKTLVLNLAMFSFLMGQPDTWSNIVNDGFGTTQFFGMAQTYDIVEFAVFKDVLYAATGRKGPGPAEIWRSATGDAGAWEKVFFDSATTTVKGIPSMNTTTLGNGYMWIETGNPFEGTVVYRTENGVDWIPISKNGFGDSTSFSPSPHMVLFRGVNDTIPYLYAGSGSHGGAVSAKVWRTPYTNTDPAKWDLMADFNIVDPAATQITYFYVWKDKLYFGANGDSILWESVDGVHFSANKGAGVNFGSPGNGLIACLIDFNGYLYASTNNQQTGGQLWRTADGLTWEPLTEDAFGYGVKAKELHNMDNANGRLWVTAYTDTAISDGSPIWKSTDSAGLLFEQSNIDGFGNPDNDGENPVTIGFKGRQYFGGPNYKDGGQIWRTGVLTGIQEPAGDDHTLIKSIRLYLNYPNPFNPSTTLRFNLPEAREIELTVYSISGQKIRTLVNGYQRTGEHRVQWDGTDESGRRTASGIYLYRLTAGNQRLSGKMILIR